MSIPKSIPIKIAIILVAASHMKTLRVNKGKRALYLWPAEVRVPVRVIGLSAIGVAFYGDHIRLGTCVFSW